MSLIKSAAEIEKIARAGSIVAEVLRRLADEARVGVSERALDTLAREMIKELGGKPAFLNYRPNGARRGFPAAICASVNEVVVHGVPSDRLLQDGDVFSIDLGAIYQGYYADAAITVPIGKVLAEAKQLIKVAREALSRGIKVAKPGNTIGDIGYAIGHFVERKGFSVVEGLTGHGVGKNLHEEPSIFNQGLPGAGIKLQPGMTLAIEPMISTGSGKIKQRADEGYVTADKSLAAHFEHTIVITESGTRILTA